MSITMICVEGYKAFSGTIRIAPRNPSVKPFELSGNWLYKPDTGCWYGSGKSFCSEICEILEDKTDGNGRAV